MKINKTREVFCVAGSQRVGKTHIFPMRDGSQWIIENSRFTSPSLHIRGVSFLLQFFADFCFFCSSCSALITVYRDFTMNVWSCQRWNMNSRILSPLVGSSTRTKTRPTLAAVMHISEIVKGFLENERWSFHEKNEWRAAVKTLWKNWSHWLFFSLS